MNTVPMRVQLPPDLTVLQCLKNVRADWVNMRAHEHTPLRDIQAWSGFGPEKPLFETILAIEDHTFGETLKSLGGDWQHREFRVFERSDYPLAAAPTRARASLCASLMDTEVSTTTRRRECSSIGAVVLMGLVTHAQRRVVDLPLLTEAEQALMHGRWNDTQKQLFAPSCLHELFEAQVARTPAAAALRLEEGIVAYDDLNARANRLARYLQSIGVGAETLVAICMARSPALIAAILAVMKSGGAYLPVDPDYPREQIALMLKDSHASVVLTQSEFRHLLPSQGLAAVSVDTCAGEIACLSADNLPASASSDNLAYAIYTSGSTGSPKLVGVEHRSAVNAIATPQASSTTPPNWPSYPSRTPSASMPACTVSSPRSLAAAASSFLIRFCRCLTPAGPPL